MKFGRNLCRRQCLRSQRSAWIVNKRMFLRLIQPNILGIVTIVSPGTGIATT